MRNSQGSRSGCPDNLAGYSASAELALQLILGEVDHRGTAVGAVVRIFGGPQLAEQRIHLRLRQRHPRAHCPVTRDRRSQRVLSLHHHLLHGDGIQQITQSNGRIRVGAGGQAGRERANQPRAIPEGFQHETVVRKQTDVAFQRTRLSDGQFGRLRDQQGLRGSRLFLHPLADLIKNHALMCRMLVDQVHAGWALGHDVCLADLAHNTQVGQNIP